MKLTLSEAKSRSKKLRDLINKYSYEYHVMDKPSVSDEVYDSLNNELKEIESIYPQLVMADSPTQRIGGKALEKFEKVEHSYPMLSLNDVFSFAEIKEWEIRINKMSGEEKLDFFCELKIDGLSVILTYKNGYLIKGATRGDGKIGEDVTQNLKTIPSIPLKLNNENRAKVDVRGEIYMSKKAFEKINQLQIKKGLQSYANPRNLAAGSIRQLDPKIAAERKLDSFVYDIYNDTSIKTHREKHEILAKWGFKTSQYVKYCHDIEAVVEYCKEWDSKRNNLDFQVDGIVIIVNNNQIFEKLGFIGKAPRGAVAYKFAAEKVTTIIEEIRVNVGRTGAVTPFAVMQPVKIAGSMVSRATLHNEDEIKKKDIRIGDTIVIQKAGDIIPEVLEAVIDLRTGNEKKFVMPIFCPVCGCKIIKPRGEAVARCTNKNCFAIKREQLIHFASKDAFDIEGLGEKIVEQLLNEGLVSDIADFFALVEGDIKNLDRLAEKSADNLIKSIKKKKKVTFNRFLYALGIRHVGSITATRLATEFHNLELLGKASLEQLLKIDDIGEVVAKSIYEWFRDSRNIKLLEKLSLLGVSYEEIKRSNKLEGLTFVITGSLLRLSREKAEEKIRLLGGKASRSVSKETSYLILGENPGSKLAKAEKLGIKIISEEDLYKMF